MYSKGPASFSLTIKFRAQEIDITESYRYKMVFTVCVKDIPQIRGDNMLGALEDQRALSNHIASS